MYRRLKAGTFLWLIMLLGALPLFGQSGSQLSGRITDPQGLQVPGAVVTLYARTGATRQSLTTDAAGEYQFERIPDGEYLVEVQATGFTSAAARSLRIEGAGSTRLDIPLELAGVRETVVVTASGTPQSADEVSKAITVVEQSELESRRDFALGEAVRGVPGLRVQQSGGPGSFTSIKTRGLRNQDTAILIDGLRIRDAGAPQGDASGLLEDFLITDVDRVEVLRGSGSSLYGTNAIGGVINVITDQGGGRTRGSVLAEGGSLGAFRGRARVGGGSKGDRIQYSVGATHLNVTDGVDGNDAARNTSGQGYFGLRLSPTMTLSGRIYTGQSFLQLNTSPQATGDIGATGVLKAVPLPADELKRYEQGASLSDLTGNGATFVPAANDPDFSRRAHSFTGAVLFSAHPTQNSGYMITYQGLNTYGSFRDGPGGVSFQPSAATRSDSIGTIHTIAARTNFRIAKFNSVDAGYEFESETYRNRAFPEDPASNSSVDVTQLSNTFSIQDQLRFLENRLQISAAFRSQFFALRHPELFPAASAPYTNATFGAPPDSYTGDASIAYFFRSTGTKIRGHAGNGYRAPSLYERFGTYFGSFGYSSYGDPRLRPERSIAFDTGLDQTLWRERVRASATYFYTRLQEVIIFDFSGAIDPATDLFGRFGGYRNTRGGLARGLELSTSTSATRDLDLSVAFTYTNADERQPVVAGVIRSFAIPDRQLSIRAAQRIGRSISVNFDLTLSSSYLAPLFDPVTFASRAFEFSGIRKADLVTTYRIPVSDLRGIRLYAKVQNLFNQTYYENGFLTPKATALGGLQFEF